jgi:protein Tex
MVLEGTVTNVAAFGAFVDIGVHQDGLVHVSQLAKGFVSDPRSVVKSGDVVRVRVLSVDIPRKRISLSLRLDDDGGADRPAGSGRPASSDRSGGADRSAGSGRSGGAGRSGGSGRPGGSGQRGSGAEQRGSGSGKRDAPVVDSAMADALRRAGLLRDKDR